MKKFLKPDIIIAFVFFVIFFIANTVILYALHTENDSVEAGDVVTALFVVSVVVVLLLSVFISARYARIHKKSIFNYFKRMWGQIIVILLFGFAITFVAVVIIEPFILPQLEKMSSPVFILTKIPFFAAYVALTYNYIAKFGYSHSQKGMFNLNFHIVALICSFMLIIPTAVKDSMYPVVNPHAAFSLNVSPTGENLNIALMVFILLATFAAEIFVFILAYIKGKQNYVKTRLSDSVFETDEI